MASPNEEIFWALTNIHDVMSAVITANKRAGVPATAQIERDWVTIYTVILNTVGEENTLDAEATEAATNLLNQLGITRQT